MSSNFTSTPNTKQGNYSRQLSGFEKNMKELDSHRLNIYKVSSLNLSNHSIGNATDIAKAVRPTIEERDD